MMTTDEMYEEKIRKLLRERYANAYTGYVTVRDPEYKCEKCGKVFKGDVFDPKGPERCPHCKTKEWHQ